MEPCCATVACTIRPLPPAPSSFRNAYCVQYLIFSILYNLRAPNSRESLDSSRHKSD